MLNGRRRINREPTHLNDCQGQQHGRRRQDIVWIGRDQVREPQDTTFLQLWYRQRCHSSNGEEKGHEQRHLNHRQQHGPERRAVVLLPQFSQFLGVDHLRALVAALGRILDLGHDDLLLWRDDLHTRIIAVHARDEWEERKSHDTGSQSDGAPPRQASVDVNDLECISEPSGKVEHTMGQAHKVHVPDTHGGVDGFRGVDDSGDIFRIGGNQFFDRGRQGVGRGLRQDVVRYLSLCWQR